MQIINSPETLTLALASSLDPTLERLLRLRVEQLTGYEGYNLDDLAVFIVVESHDTLAAIEAELRIPLTVNMVDGSRWPDPDFCPNWEWCERIDGIYEITFILDDSGYGHVIFVPDRADIDATLLSLCRAYAEPESSADTVGNADLD